MKAGRLDTKCHRCGGYASFHAYVEGRDTPMCLYCRLEDLRDELERREASADLLASFPQRQSPTRTFPGGAEVLLQNLTLKNDMVRDLDGQNLVLLDWAIKLLRGDVGTASTGDNLSGLANSVVQAEMAINAKNALIQNLGVLALDGVTFKLLKAHPGRD
jgi:hypothetical protein